MTVFVFQILNALDRGWRWRLEMKQDDEGVSEIRFSHSGCVIPPLGRGHGISDSGDEFLLLSSSDLIMALRPRKVTVTWPLGFSCRGVGFDSEPGKSFSASIPTTGATRKVRGEVCLRGQN